MTIQDFEAMLRDSGVDDAAVKALVANEKVAARATSLRQGTEYSTLEQRALELEQKLNGANGKPGAKSYEDWYQKNFAQIQKLQADTAKYQERYGSLDEAAPPQQQPAGMSAADIKKMVADSLADSFRSTYAPQVVSAMTGIGGVVEKHMRRGRKENIDWKKLDELAATTNGDISAAYDIYDKPNTDADVEASVQKRIDAAVKEKLAAAGVSRFPAGADGAPSSRSPLASAGEAGAGAAKTYDRSKLLETFVSGEYTGFGKTQ